MSSGSCRPGLENRCLPADRDPEERSPSLDRTTHVRFGGGEPLFVSRQGTTQSNADSESYSRKASVSNGWIAR